MVVSAFRKVGGKAEAALLEPKAKRLNLGCGLRRKEGWINLDSSQLVGADIIRDVTTGLPFDDHSIDEIEGLDFLEHLPRSSLIFVLNECHRVLRPGGQAVFEVPNVLSKEHPEWAFGDPTHQSFFCLHTFDYFQAGAEQHEVNGRYYYASPWEIETELKRGDGIIRATMRPKKG